MILLGGQILGQFLNFFHGPWAVKWQKSKQQRVSKLVTT